MEMSPIKVTVTQQSCIKTKWWWQWLLLKANVTQQCWIRTKQWWQLLLKATMTHQCCIGTEQQLQLQYKATVTQKSCIRTKSSSSCIWVKENIGTHTVLFEHWRRRYWLFPTLHWERAWVGKPSGSWLIHYTTPNVLHCMPTFQLLTITWLSYEWHHSFM